MNLFHESAGFTPAEIEFRSENELIDIIPTERMAMIQLISVCP